MPLYVFDMRARALIVAAVGAVLAIVLGAEGATETGAEREVVLLSECWAGTGIAAEIGIAAEAVPVIPVSYGVAVAVVVLVVVVDGTVELRQHQDMEDSVGLEPLDAPW